MWYVPGSSFTAFSPRGGCNSRRTYSQSRTCKLQWNEAVFKNIKYYLSLNLCRIRADVQTSGWGSPRPAQSKNIKNWENVSEFFGWFDLFVRKGLGKLCIRGKRGRSKEGACKFWIQLSLGVMPGERCDRNRVCCLSVTFRSTCFVCELKKSQEWEKVGG